MIRPAVVFVCLALSGCSAARTPEANAVNLGVKFTLAPGTTVSSKSGDVKVRFVAVTEDSRCPSDVTCVWAGEVKVLLEVHESSKGGTQVEIAEGGSTVAGAYRVTLEQVDPKPTSKATIAPQDYRATLQVDKAS